MLIGRSLLGCDPSDRVRFPPTPQQKEKSEMAYTKKQKELVNKAEKEKLEFLEKNPHLKDLQASLDKKIKKAKRN